MTVAVWPSDLPRPTRGGYQATWQEARLKTLSDNGPPGFRRRFSSVARTVSLSIVVGRAGKAMFETFYRDVTAHGSLPFEMPDPVTDGYLLLDHAGRPILTDPDLPILLAASWLCLFGDAPPSERTDKLRFEISFSVVVLP